MALRVCILNGIFNLYRQNFLTWIIHQEIWRCARRPGNGGGNVPKYVEYTIYETTQHTVKFRRVLLTKIELNNLNDC